MTDLDYQIPAEYPGQRLRPRTTLPPPPEKIINAIKMVDDYLADPKGAIEKEKLKVKGYTNYPSIHVAAIVSMSQNQPLPLCNFAIDGICLDFETNQ